MNKQRTLNNTKLDDSDLDMLQIPNQYQRLLRKDIIHSYYEYYLNGIYRDWETDRKSTRLNSSHSAKSRMPSSA